MATHSLTAAQSYPVASPRTELSLLELEKALGNGCNGEVQKLLEQEPKFASEPFNALSKEYNGSTPLHIAASRGDCDLGNIIIAALERTGKPIDELRDADDNRPQHWAALGGKLEFLKLLKAHGATMTVENRLGTSPLHDGVRCGDPKIVNYLLDNSSPYAMQKRNYYGFDAFSLAAHYFRTDTLRYFLSQHAQESHELLNSQNLKHYTPLDLLEKHWMKLSKAITSSGEILDEQHATRKSYLESKALLEEAGAVHSDLWNEQTARQREAYIAVNSEPWRNYQREHGTTADKRMRAL